MSASARAGSTPSPAPRRTVPRSPEARSPQTCSPVPWFGRSPRRMFFFLWALAFFHRLFLQLGSIDRAWPFPVFYEGDAETFHNFALAILAGQPYDGGIPFHPPLYPLFLAVCQALLGNPAGGMVLRLVHGTIFALTVPVLWLWLRRHLAPGAALAGALLAAWSFGLSLIATSAVSEGLYLLLLLLGLLAFDRLRDALAVEESPPLSAKSSGRSPARASRGRVVQRSVLLGVLCGLLALTRAEGLGWSLIVLAIGAVAGARAVIPRSPLRSGWRHPAVRRALRPWGIALGALCLVLTPWVIRNAVVLTRVNRVATARGMAPLPVLVVTTAYGPLNFALANHAGAPGYFTRSVLSNGPNPDLLDLNNPQHRDFFLHGYARGWDWIRGHPADFLALIGRKLGLTARALRLGWTQWDLPGGLRGTRYPVDLLTPDAFTAVAVHLALLLPGAWLVFTGRAGAERRSGRLYLVIGAAYVCFTGAVAAAFFGYARQGLLALAILSGLEGATVAAVAGRLGRTIRGRIPSPRLIGGLIIAVWLVEMAGAFQARDFIASGETEVGSKMLNRDSIMTLSPRRQGSQIR